MSMKHSGNIWIRRQQCPCGDWKCYIKSDGDERKSCSSQILKPEPASTCMDVSFPPYVGQVFVSDEEAFEFYSNFARKNGFSIRKARSTESQNLGIYRRDFVCYRSGFNQPRKKANVEHPRDRKSVRCGCDAKLYLTKEIVDGVPQWYVSQFSNVHNHELLGDDQVRLLPAYRKIQEGDQERILLLSKAGFPVNRIVKVLELEKGVQPGQLPFIEKDVRNFLRTCKKSVQENDALLNEKRENDTNELLEACKGMIERDRDFAYDYSIDESARVENIAWSYGDSVRAYQIYGDVVNFEASYRSITYGLVLGVWFGIDNNGRIILFGCALLQDECSQSFGWALQTFIRFMRGKHPQTILTDIDFGLKDAIATELPNTKHVISLWHIHSKFSSWFSQPLGLQCEEFKTAFDMLNHLGSVEDFEHQWNVLMTRFGLTSDKHFALLYSFRVFWSDPFIRGYFLASLASPEHVHSMESILKTITSGQSCLQVFFQQASVSGNYMGRDMQLYMHTKTCLPMEEHARNVLTPYAFGLLQHELVLSLQYGVQDMADGSYLVRHFEKLDGGYFVFWVAENEEIHCSCKEFENSGILCRHALRVLFLKNYFQLPERYYLLRWRREHSIIGIIDHHTQHSNDNYVELFHSLAYSLLSESCLSKERSSHVQRELNTLLEYVRNMPVEEECLANGTANNLTEV